MAGPKESTREQVANKIDANRQNAASGELNDGVSQQGHAGSTQNASQGTDKYGNTGKSVMNGAAPGSDEFEARAQAMKAMLAARDGGGGFAFSGGGGSTLDTGGDAAPSVERAAPAVSTKGPGMAC